MSGRQEKSMTVNKAGFNEEFNKILVEYIDALKAEVEFRLKNWHFVSDKRYMYSVVQGLLSRQYAITSELVGCDVFYKPNIAGILFRAMLDVYITMAWILKEDSETRAQQFMVYGLGQEKLMKEVRENSLKNDGMDPTEDPFVQTSTRIINMMTSEELLDIKIGSWSGKPISKMAEEAGILSLYNYSYLPFSQDVHSNWPHLVRFNLEICRNPLHKFHLKGVIRKPQARPLENLEIATKYMKKVITLFDENIKLDLTGVKNSYELFWDRMNEFIDKYSEASE